MVEEVVLTFIQQISLTYTPDFTPVEEIIFFNLIMVGIAVLIQLLCEWYDRRKGVATIGRKAMVVMFVLSGIVINMFLVASLYGSSDAKL